MSNHAEALETRFGVDGRVAVVTGGSSGLGRELALALGHLGARVVVVSRREAACVEVARAIEMAGGDALAIGGDVLDRDALQAAQVRITAHYGAVDVLINAAGGNAASATTTATHSFFDLDLGALRGVVDLNFLGAVQSCQVFGREMAQRGAGAIVNVASMSALRPLSRVPAYSGAKAALVNFTQWLAVLMAQEYGPQLRVNAIAPGFFLTEQNRYLLTDATSGAPTPRAATILAHTPMARLGSPDDLVGTLLWLVSPASAFVTGIVVPVDGGFSAFGGV